ncbi:unnamed protein product [Arabis nemorensis]|uniref:Uncharacterized protein n=1 Tax=Arabis nemorensis TaxID=586526 RepID=A0A565B4V1_9BRAS|nr:unnamed protein product [Arabis nemorensis]
MRKGSNKTIGSKASPECAKPEKRNLQDLWKAALPIGTEWKRLDALYEHNWDFKHLEEALEEGGILYGKKVYVFVNTEPQLVLYKGVNKVVPVPTVVAIESPFPPSDKISIISVQREEEEIIPMKQMELEWAPYIPFEEREETQVDRMKYQIFIMACTQERATLRHLEEERSRKFDCCLPYFYDPFEEDELEQSTEVQILFPSEPPVVCLFDWDVDRLEVFVDDLIKDEELCAEQKDEFKEFVEEHVQAAKKARLEATAARMKAIEEMSEDAWQAFQSTKFYKFYPQPSPDFSGLLRVPMINRYYRDAHMKKTPANLTNIAMADARKPLAIIEGLDKTPTSVAKNLYSSKKDHKR